ncbi:MAG: hypothetical protein Q4A01_11220 [Coriobacteriales bacterium]|nr:hypothetical protein [Coriobacteriales bacterium]
MHPYLDFPFACNGMLVATAVVILVRSRASEIGKRVARRLPNSRHGKNPRRERTVSRERVREASDGRRETVRHTITETFEC